MKSLHTLNVIYWKEVQEIANSPILYAFLSIGAFVVGALFFLGLTIEPAPNLRLLTINLSLVLSLLIPAIGMRMIAEEAKQGTLEMLLTMPIQVRDLVIGKFLASFTISSALLVYSLGCAFVLEWLGTPDWGAIFAALCGQGLCLSLGVSVVLFASSLTKEPTAAALLGSVFLLGFWCVDAIIDGLGTSVDVMWLVNMKKLSLMAHLSPFSKGIVDVRDIFWFLFLTGLFLWWTTMVLEQKRCQ